MTTDPFDPLSLHSATWLLRWVRAQLDGSSTEQALGPPPAGVRAAQPTTVILTVFDRKGGLGVTGQGGGLLEAVMGAVAEALLSVRTANRVQLDIVQGDPTPLVKPAADGKLPDRAARDAWHRLTSFQDGLVVGQGGQARWLTPTQLVLQGMSRQRRDVEAPSVLDVVGAAMARLGLPPDAWTDPAVELWQIQTSAWVESADRERALPLVQGAVPVERYDRDRLVASALAAGDYLLRVLNDEGRFAYTLDRWLEARSRNAYNIVRHAGSASALFELGAATGEQRFVVGGVRAMRYLARSYRPGAADGLTYVLDRDGKGKLGALGLALVALSRKLEHAPEPADREHALALGRQIVAMQHPDGSFESYLRVRGDEPTGSTSLYYPGEAMLGLARVVGLGLDDGFMAAAHRGADFLIASRQGREKMPPDAWLIQALEVLYEDDPKPSYVEHAIAIARSMMTDQFGPDAPVAFAGGFRPEPIRSTRTSARVEGMVSAHRLAARAGDERAPSILAAAMRTPAHLLPMLLDADNSFFLPKPDPALGGMRGGLDDAEIRIDYVQHHISAMLGLAALIEG